MANEPPWLRMTAKEAIDAWNTWGDRFWKRQAMTDQQHMPLPNDPDGLVEWLRTAPSNEWCGPMLNKAADEIVALRKLTDGNWVWQQITSARADALEEAAQYIEWRYRDCGRTADARECVATIRALASPPEPSANE